MPRIACPVVLHLAGNDPAAPPAAVEKLKQAVAGQPEASLYVYPGTAPGFERKRGGNTEKAAAGLAHSRSIALLRRVMGPHYDLEALWEAHTRYEFETRDVDATMATMVGDPYVNHVPVMTGGVGQRDLARFYANHFIPTCPADIAMVPVSRTIGADRVVDEMVVSFTHDREIDWMLPGIAPTGAGSKCRSSRSSVSAATSSTTSTSTGIRRAFWCRSVCSIRTGSRSPGSRPPTSSSTKPCPRTH